MNYFLNLNSLDTLSSPGRADKAVCVNLNKRNVGIVAGADELFEALSAGRAGIFVDRHDSRKEKRNGVTTDADTPEIHCSRAAGRLTPNYLAALASRMRALRRWARR